MATVALIFAGGMGKRMNNTSRPKQFIVINGKPIIIHTLEKFAFNSSIDSVVIVCLSGYLDTLRKMIRDFKIPKVTSIVEGGRTGQESIYNGLVEIEKLCFTNPIVLIHDGVRPFISKELINENIKCAEKNGNAITVAKAIETIAVSEETGKIQQIYDRSNCVVAKAPQTFYLDDILSVHKKALEDGFIEAVDSASLMFHYGKPLFAVPCSGVNIKITTPEDYYFARSLFNMEEDAQLKQL